MSNILPTKKEPRNVLQSTCDVANDEAIITDPRAEWLLALAGNGSGAIPPVAANDSESKRLKFPMTPEEMPLWVLFALHSQKPCAEATRAKDRTYRKQHLEHYRKLCKSDLSGRDVVVVADITVARQQQFRDLRAAQSGRRSELMSSYALRNPEDYLNRAVAYSVEKGFLTHGIEVIREERPKWVGPLVDDETMFLLRIEADGKRNASIALSLQFFAGLDHEECRRLTWSHVDFAAGTLKPPTALNKDRGHERPPIKMSTPLRAALEHAYRGRRTKWVLEHNSRPIKSLKDTFTPIRHRVMERYRRRMSRLSDESARKILADRIAALDRAHINTLRSSVPVVLLARGCSATHVASFIDLRWEDFKERYAETIPDGEDAAIKALNSFKF